MASAASPGAQIEAYPWQTERFVLMPYEADKFPANYLEDALRRLAAEDSSSRAFPDGILTGAPITALLARCHIILGLIKPKLELAGMAAVWDIQGERGWRRAEIGFAFFRHYWATRLIRDMALMAIESVYCEAGVDRLVGTVIADNFPARAFAMEIGFDELAALPQWLAHHGRFRDAVVVARNKEAGSRVRKSARPKLRE